MSPGNRLIDLSVPLDHRAGSESLAAQTVRDFLSRSLACHQRFQVGPFRQSCFGKSFATCIVEQDPAFWPGPYRVALEHPWSLDLEEDAARTP
jgi:hypothetical protein